MKIKYEVRSSKNFKKGDIVECINLQVEKAWKGVLSGHLLVKESGFSKAGEPYIIIERDKEENKFRSENFKLLWGI